MRLARIVFLVFLGVVCVRGAEAADGDMELFEKHVRPFLVEHCFECHAEGAKRIEGGLYLDSRAAMLEGGDSGPALVPGDADESLLIQAIKYESFEMPPKGPRPEGEIEPIVEWVKRGAVWPNSPDRPKGQRESFDREERMASHWSWKALETPAVPEVSNREWPRDAVDSFVAAKLESAGLKPGGDADKATWLRRVTFDLTGLPPTLDEQAAYLSDASDEAESKVVDRLLASEQFGVHWARHWLDLARYAETYGHEFDYSIPHAWKYRDYVVRAINDDVPYDQFAREQVAGDLLEQPRVDAETGLNQSAHGSAFWFLGEALHAPTDIHVDLDSRIENQIDVFSRSFLGLSVACARCHDHKFDPISTEDYYSLYGVLRATYRDQALLDPTGRIAEIVREIESETEKEIDSERPVSEETFVGEGTELFASFISGADGWTARGQAFEHRAVDEPIKWDWQQGRSASRGVFDSGRVANKLEGTLRSPTFTISHPQIHWRVRTSGATFRVVIENYFMHDRHQLLYGDSYKANQKTDGWGWVTHTGDLRNHIGKRAFLEVIDDGEGRVEIDSVWFGNRPDLPAPPEIAVSGELEQLANLQELAASIPRPERVLSAGEGTSVDEPIHIRGGARKYGDLAPRRFPVAISGDDQQPIEEGSGRLDVAERLTDPTNPFFARVAVNRVWHHLFGRGLVASVDDFGVMGQEPSHPALLDYLATEFVDDGYSVKRLIRRLVLSRTYGMSSDLTSGEAADPDNILLHRANVRRLSGEQLRDALLTVTGELDRSMGGPSVPIHLTAHMTGRGRPGQNGPLDGNKRRSLYVEVRRNFLSPMMLTFDTPSPFSTLGKRNVSNVPAQSLVLMNSPFVSERAKAFAERLMRDAGSAEERIDLAYRLAFGREPTSDERAALREIVAERDDAEQWTVVCHALVNVKEFVFVR